jgi:putative ABC transport system ATP-binding protein
MSIKFGSSLSLNEFANAVATVGSDVTLIGQGEPGIGKSAMLKVIAKRFPDQISGGQRQRVAIARSIVGSRKVILADEPTGALDSRTGEAVIRALRERIDGGAAGILVTHDAKNAAWADRILLIRDGSIVDEARTKRDLNELMKNV